MNWPGTVVVLAGKSFIEAYQITDERLNPEACGVVTHLFEQVDTAEIFNEWQLYLMPGEHTEIQVCRLA